MNPTTFSKLVKTVIACIISGSIFTPVLLSQEIWNNAVSIPPSPNGSSLGKYGEFPIDKSTGVPSVSIPIYEINYGGMKVPISLNYHASGNKVNEEESWVGMGWSLNAGGVITRVMKGRPDELQYGFLTHCNINSIPTEEHVNSRYSLPICSIKDSLELISNNQWDYEPDVFYYNFLSFSGSFHFDNTGKPQLRPAGKEKLEFLSYQTSHSFRFTDTEGNVYNFEEAELTTANIKGQIPQFISSWYLTSISNPKTSRTIVFHYNTNQNVKSQYLMSQSKMYRQLIGGHYELIYGSDQYANTTSNITGEKFLSQIDFGLGTLSTSISDAYPNHKKLNSIFISNGTEIVKTFSFNYSILQSNITKRLNLSSFSEIADGTSKVYSFTYDNQLLPDYNSKMVDHWGYFNGQNNPELIPQQILGNQTVCTADREAHWPYTQAGVLKRITFPTGGYTEFEYENNSYSYLGDYPTVEESFTLALTGNYNAEKCISRNIFWICDTVQCDTIYSDFKIVTSVMGPGQAAGLENDPSIQNMNSIFYGGPKFDPEIYLPDHYGRFDFRSDGNVVYNNVIVEAGSSSLVQLPNLSANSYYTHKACASDHLTTTTSVFSYKTRLKGKTMYSPLMGGIRVKKITTFDPLSGQYNYKTYDYNLSGYLTYGLPRYSVESQYYSDDGGLSPLYNENRVFLYASPVGGLGSSGTSVAYQKVTEFLGTESDNTGKIETTFLPSQDEVSNSRYYSATILNNQWLRSKVLTETYFRKVNTTYDTVLKKNLIYQFTPYSITLGFRASRTSINDVDGWQTPCLYDEFTYSNFQIRSTNALLWMEKERSFFPGNRITERINFKLYDTIHWNHFSPIGIKTYNSDGDKVLIRYLYPHDTTGNNLATMKNLNIIEYPVYKVEKVNGSKTQGSQWNFKIDLNNLVLDSEKEFVRNDASRDVNTFEYYDNVGNPTQILNKNGIRTSYLWGYNQEYPVAKIENASLADIKTALGVSVIPNLGAGGLSPTQDNLLRSGLSKAFVTTFSYKPLIGIISQTDANGVITHYEYDGFGRLKIIKDDDGHILKSYEYHYK